MKKTLFLLFICSIYLTGCGDTTTIQEIPNTNTLQESDFVLNDPETTESSEIYDTAEESESIAEIEYLSDTSITVLGEKEFETKLLELKAEIYQAEHTNGEILFNNIPWGTNHFSANEQMKEMDGFINMGLQNIPVAFNYLLGLDSGLPAYCYDSDTIGGISWSTLNHMTVAGYEVDECRLLFASVETEDGYILSEENSVLYGAYYVLKDNSDGQNMKEDLLTKLITVYGEPNKIIEYQIQENSDYTEEYIYWYGDNDSVLMLHNNKISYAWLGGENLLNNAIQHAFDEQQEQENEIYGNGDTFGL